MNAEDAAHVLAALTGGEPALSGEQPICLPDSETDSTETEYVVHERYVTEVKAAASAPGEPRPAPAAL